MSLRIRRGLEANRTSVTPLEGEFIYTTDTKIVYIGDGTTAGGNALSGGGANTSQYLQVANASATFQTIANERAALANTNAFIKAQLANTNSYIATRASWTSVTSTNTALRTLISDRLQVANATLLINDRMQVANTNALVNDRLQVANAASLYVTKIDPATSGLLEHTGRATISTNLSISGNTTVSGLVANGSLGTANYVLKTNGTTVFWGESAVGGGGGSFANGQSISVLNFVATGNSQLSGLLANGSLGTSNYVLKTNGTTVFWGESAGGGSTTQYLEVANANATFVTKVDPATSGVLEHTGRATISTNLTVSGNTVASRLVANGSLGTANFVLKTNGTTTFWGAAAAGGGVTLANETASATTHYPAMSTTTSGSWSDAKVSTTKLYFTPSTGQLNATIFNSLSDERVKKDIVTINEALDTVNNMRGVKFNWKETSTPSIGLIAQEVEKLLPALVHTSENDEKSVNYGGIVGVLVEAIKELSARIDKLEGK